MEIYLVRFSDDCGDLNSCWTSYRKAWEYIEGEAKRCGWTRISEYRNFDASYGEYKFSFNGNIFTAEIEGFTLDERPYF
jgi:hypothetical protein